MRRRRAVCRPAPSRQLVTGGGGAGWAGRHRVSPEVNGNARPRRPFEAGAAAGAKALGCSPRRARSEMRPAHGDAKKSCRCRCLRRCDRPSCFAPDPDDRHPSPRTGVRSRKASSTRGSGLVDPSSAHPPQTVITTCKLHVRVLVRGRRDQERKRRCEPFRLQVAVFKPKSTAPERSSRASVSVHDRFRGRHFGQMIAAHSRGFCDQASAAGLICCGVRRREV